MEKDMEVLMADQIEDPEEESLVIKFKKPYIFEGKSYTEKNLLQQIQRSFGSVTSGYAAVLFPHALYPFRFRAVTTPIAFSSFPCGLSRRISVPSANTVALIGSE